jgi:predicted ATPase
MLKKIKIKGYKSIQSLELELNKINILIGANGAGKSNLISFFKLLSWMIQSQGKLQFFIAQSGGANSLLFDGVAITPQLEAELNFETDSGQNDYYFRLFHAASDTLIFFITASICVGFSLPVLNPSSSIACKRSMNDLSHSDVASKL